MHPKHSLGKPLGVEVSLYTIVSVSLVKYGLIYLQETRLPSVMSCFSFVELLDRPTITHVTPALYLALFVHLNDVYA